MAVAQGSRPSPAASAASHWARPGIAEAENQLCMIFHHPYPMPELPGSGSRVRLVQMKQAFCQSGFRVSVVAGFARDRKLAMREIMVKVQEGVRYAFLYSESSALPSLMAKGNLLHIQSDPRFFQWCKGQGIPIGLFYRDVHWRFGQFRRLMLWHRRPLARALYWYDWLNYRKYVDHLFLPSLAMRQALPGTWPGDRLSALPPGCSISIDGGDKPGRAGKSGKLALLYVGGVLPPLYDLKPMLDTIHELEGVHLTLCCRAAEWERAQGHYAPVDRASVRIVHAHGDELETLYASADAFALAWRPNPYLEFAMPVKVLESLGHGVPLIATEGTEAARLVRQEGIGWTVSDENELRALLVNLKANREEISAKRAQARQVRTRHTWQARAETAAARLAGQWVER